MNCTPTIWSRIYQTDSNLTEKKIGNCFGEIFSYTHNIILLFQVITKSNSLADFLKNMSSPQLENRPRQCVQRRQQQQQDQQWSHPRHLLLPLLQPIKLFIIKWRSAWAVLSVEAELPPPEVSAVSAGRLELIPVTLWRITSGWTEMEGPLLRRTVSREETGICSKR